MTTCEFCVSQTRDSYVLAQLSTVSSHFSFCPGWNQFASLIEGIVHTFVRDVEFLVNFLHGIAFISLNKNGMMSFRRKFCVFGQFETKIKPTNADAPDTQLPRGRPALLLL